uniref:hypothetical protein n=1 Tax=Nonomuraea sp. CA-251285 TaxID=3240002 RepID=UPI003F490E18
MPTAGEFPDGSLPPDASIGRAEHHTREDAAQQALWRLYAYVRHVNMTSPCSCRPGPDTMGAVVAAHLEVARHNLVALSAAAYALTAAVDRDGTHTETLIAAVGGMRRALAEADPPFPGYFGESASR